MGTICILKLRPKQKNHFNSGFLFCSG